MIFLFYRKIIGKENWIEGGGIWWGVVNWSYQFVQRFSFLLRWAFIFSGFLMEYKGNDERLDFSFSPIFFLFKGKMESQGLFLSWLVIVVWLLFILFSSAKCFGFLLFYLFVWWSLCFICFYFTLCLNKIWLVVYCFCKMVINS